MIVITGAAGFIGRNLVLFLQKRNYNDLILVDEYSKLETIYTNSNNLVDRDQFKVWLDQNHQLVQYIFHLGARTDTIENDKELLYTLNTGYTKSIWAQCIEYGLPFLYASSAATYGDGTLGFNDTHSEIEKLKPLNEYALSKHNFDLWALAQEKTPYQWVGLKFFNVFGPFEETKGRMASMVYHGYLQAKEKGKIRLFAKDNNCNEDGGHKRDFVFVEDICEMCFFFMNNRNHSGIFNAGTGEAKTFKELAQAVFKSINSTENIEYFHMPEDLKGKYQYLTEAKMSKYLEINPNFKFKSFEEAIFYTIKTLV